MIHRIRRRNPGRSGAGLPQNRLKIPFLCNIILIPSKNATDLMQAKTLDRINISPAGLSAEEIHSDANDNLIESGKVRSRILLLLKRRYCTVTENDGPGCVRLVVRGYPSKEHLGIRQQGAGSYRFLTRKSHIRISV